MQIVFNKLKIKNFLSYGDAEILLRNNDYCIVSGVNKFSKDNALSNGAGKSTWSSAICFALTGETIKGIKSDLKNRFVDEKECWVELDFNVDADNYVIKRFKEPKTDLNIILNGNDISGKGIRESELILSEHLPDITPSLLAGIIILGQGLPYKFTDNSPSGRKDVLEKLSKSDFMIQDIKERIAKRELELRSDLRKCEDEQLVIKTKISTQTSLKTKAEAELLELSKPQTFEEDIINYTNTIEAIRKLLEEDNSERINLTSNKERLEAEYNETYKKQSIEINELLDAFREVERSYREDKNNATITYNNSATKLKESYNDGIKEIDDSVSKTLNDLIVRMNTLGSEIIKAQNIKDVCPTCGQKLPNVFKPDTTKMEAELKELEKQRIEIETQVREKKNSLKESFNQQAQKLTSDYNSGISQLDDDWKKKNSKKEAYQTEIETKYKDTLEKIKNNLNELKNKIIAIESKINSDNSSLRIAMNNLDKANNAKATYADKLNSVKKSLDDAIQEITLLETKLKETENEISSITEHLGVISKMNSLVKRDFRGFLLAGIINFISEKCKEYSLDIFGTDELNFSLDGNNINISYLGKPFENLSGGEAQKVDLIIQFAIRDMMTTYLDFSSNILVLDEIFDQLDELSCTNVLNLIANKLNDIESLYIISHRADELEIPYDHEMIITKNELGISSIQQL